VHGLFPEAGFNSDVSHLIRKSIKQMMDKTNKKIALTLDLKNLNIPAFIPNMTGYCKP